MLIFTLGLALASAMLLWTYLRIKNRRLVVMGDKIPGPKPLPIIGNALEFGLTPKGAYYFCQHAHSDEFVSFQTPANVFIVGNSTLHCLQIQYKAVCYRIDL